MRKHRPIICLEIRSSGVCCRPENMIDEVIVDKIVTKFLLNTCRLRPWPSLHAVQAAVMCGIAGLVRYDEHVECSSLITGSMAEFYIEPILPHCGDVDIMYHSNDMLVIPRGHPPPTQLPAEFHNHVQVFEIIDSYWSGYVYLALRYLLTKCSGNDWYNGMECNERTRCLTKGSGRGLEDHGPAQLARSHHVLQLPTDLVYCVRCLSWPPHAADWPTRHRSYGWPDSETVDRVVRNGCDFVQIAHHLCRQDEVMSKHQWRLSFSRAEVTLINSWMPVQQIVYHVMRVFMKPEQKLTKSANRSNSGVGTLSNYHIKTLMLWACELKPKSWWADDLRLIRISVELLHTLAVWLNETRCPHYFINNCNLVDQSFALDMTVSRLLLVDKDCLSSWFVTSYIRQSVHICPERVSRLFDDVNTSTKLENAVSAVVDWRLNTTTAEIWYAFYTSEFSIAHFVTTLPRLITVRLCVCLITELSKINSHFSLYFTAVVFLHVAHKIARDGSIQNLMKALSATSSAFVSSNPYIERRLLSLLTTVVILACRCQTTALMNSADCNTSKLVELLQQYAVELLTAFRHFESRVFASVATIVTTDFEALYAYKRGDYQRCLQLSTRNIIELWNADRVHCSVSALPEFIQFLDDDIVSLIALTLIINQKCTDEYIFNSTCVTVTQVTLSLYLMTQCQLKLRHSVTSLAQTLDYIKVAHRRHPAEFRLDRLTLKLAECKGTTQLRRLLSN